jgi:hypothetical protein
MSVDRIDALSRSLADGASRRSILRLLGVGVAGTAITAVGFHDTLAKGNKGKHKAKGKAKKSGSGKNPLENIALSGTADDGSAVDGSLDVRKFVEDNGQIIAIGKLSGTLTKKGKTHKFTQGTVRVPVSIVDSGSGAVSAQQLECEVLHLVLGPLDLTLLGLHVHLNEVDLNITADPSGGLLGQLLCSLAGGGPLSQIVSLLNQILGILQGL